MSLNKILWKRMCGSCCGNYTGHIPSQTWLPAGCHLHCYWYNITQGTFVGIENMRVSRKGWKYSETCVIMLHSYRAAARASAQRNPSTNIVNVVVCECQMHVMLRKPIFEWYDFIVIAACWPDMTRHCFPWFDHTMKIIFHGLCSCTIDTDFEIIACKAGVSLSSGCHLQILMYIVVSMHTFIQKA